MSEINISYKNLKIQGHFHTKYRCEMWTLKALLEYLLKIDGDFIIGNQFGFVFNPKNNFLSSEIIPLYEWLRNIINVEIKEEKFPESVEYTENVLRQLKNNIPVYTFAVAYELPYHYDYKDRLSESKKKVEEEKLSNIIEKGNTDTIGGHSILITGYDKVKDSFHISDLYHTEMPAFYGWVNRSILLNAVTSPFLGDNKSTILKASELEGNLFKQDIDSLIIRNKEFMLQTKNQEDYHFGLSGLEQLIEYINRLSLLSTEETIPFQDYMFNSLLDIMMQRDRYLSYLDLVKENSKLNIKPLMHELENNYHIYCRIRNMFFKGSRKITKDYLGNITGYMNEVYENEKKGLLCI